ncbi:MAG: hypothetical protein WC807_17155 [Hyphomicrobium sp.]|jgi:hypothetical protein
MRDEAADDASPPLRVTIVCRKRAMSAQDDPNKKALAGDGIITNVIVLTPARSLHTECPWIKR